jgi:hypothetical protein
VKEFQRLSMLLERLPVGKVQEVGEVESALSGCWDKLKGGDEEGMEPHKVSRMEQVTWNPPCLQFTVERHGGIVLGSTRAELQRWEVNVAERRAVIVGSGRGQLRQMSPRLDVRPIAKHTAEKVRGRAEDDALEWKGPDLIRINLARLVSTEGFKETIAGRRKRLFASLKEELLPLGWKFESRSSHGATFRRIS